MTEQIHAVTLSWIIVCHDSRRDLGLFLPSLTRALADLDARGLPAELVIVDNASRDGSAELATRLAPRARVLRNPENQGYGAAVNRAAAVARGAWLAVGNADLFVPRGGLDALPGVLAAAPPDVALLGPAIHDATGRLGLSAGRFPSLATLLAGLLRRCHRRKYLHERAHVPGPVDWLTGACFFARRDAFLALGGFDPEFFLYYEDVDLARRAAGAGHRVVYEPTLDVVHVRPHHGRPPRRDIEVIVRASRRRYFGKHRPRWEGLLLEVLSRVEPLVRPRSVGAAPAPRVPAAEASGEESASTDGEGPGALDAGRPPA